jgi:hypothetical protein
VIEDKIDFSNSVIEDDADDAMIEDKIDFSNK